MTSWHASGNRTADACSPKLSEGFITYAAWSPDNEHIVTAGKDRTARVWYAQTGHLLFSLEGHAGSVLHAAYRGDGRRIVTSSSDQTARIWDAGSGRPWPSSRDTRLGSSARPFIPMAVASSPSARTEAPECGKPKTDVRRCGWLSPS